MRGHIICFHLEVRKIIFELSSIPPLIWNSGVYNLAIEYMQKSPEKLQRVMFLSPNQAQLTKKKDKERKA